MEGTEAVDLKDKPRPEGGKKQEHASGKKDVGRPKKINKSKGESLMKCSTSNDKKIQIVFD